MDDENDLATLVGKGLAALTALAVGAYSLWCTWIAFAGGTMPLLGWEVSGGIGTGLFWLFIVDPIIITIGYWLSMLAVIPITLLLSLIFGRR